MRRLSPRLFKPRAVAGANAAPVPASAGAGHAELFRATFLPHLDGAYNLARFLTRDPVLSDDIVQDAFLRAFRAFPKFRGGSARAWLFTIVRNCSRTAMASRAQHAARTPHGLTLSDVPQLEIEELADGRENPEEALIRQQDAAAVRQLVESLPEPFREALILREMEELSYQEIAEVTGVAIGTVMSRLARARAMLARRFAGATDASEGGSRSSA
jgi:RNA polymerase sigma factor (sigma-70 family)